MFLFFDFNLFRYRARVLRRRRQRWTLSLPLGRDGGKTIAEWNCVTKEGKGGGGFSDWDRFGDLVPLRFARDIPRGGNQSPDPGAACQRFDKPGPGIVWSALGSPLEAVKSEKWHERRQKLPQRVMSSLFDFINSNTWSWCTVATIRKRRSRCHQRASERHDLMAIRCL